MPKRTLDSFVKVSSSKKPRHSADELPLEPTQSTNHITYPWAIPHLPRQIASETEIQVTASGKEIKNRPDLDLLYFQPFVPRVVERQLFEFLRSQLFFYRVKYTIQRGGTTTDVNTPRYTTVFGIDETSVFTGESSSIVEAADQSKPVPKSKYQSQPRPIPECLDFLRRITEAATNTSYNFCLVNYYATGEDSISYHSDDERFLGLKPAIASFSLGAKRDFLMKHKPLPPGSAQVDTDSSPLKLQLSSGDMILMRGPTQSNWLHSLPKRKGADVDKGRINITFRRAMIPAGTENYYRYNVGGGTPFRWSAARRTMLPWPAKQG